MNRIIFYLYIFFLLHIIPNVLRAQTKTAVGESQNTTKYFIGGGFGITFGTQTNIYVAPEIAYAINNNLHIGVGLSYEYSSYHNFIPKRTINIYGGKAFARYFIFDDFFAYAEFEKLYFRDNYINPTNSPLIAIEGFYAGGGYRQWFGTNSFGTIALLFDLTNSNYLFGINPFLRVGMAVGI